MSVHTVQAQPKRCVEKELSLQADNIDKESSPDLLRWLLLHCLGFGAFWGFIHISSFGTVLFMGSNEAGSLDAWLTGITANGLSMLFLGVLAKRFAPLGSRRALVVSFVLFAMVGALFLVFSNVFPHVAFWLFLGSILSGIGTAGMLLLWAEAYGEIDLDAAGRFALPAAMGTGVVLYLLIVLLPLLIAIAITILLPLTSILCLKATSKTGKIGVALERPGNTTMKKSFLQFDVQRLFKLAVILVVYSLTLGFTRGRLASFTEVSVGGSGTAVFAVVAVILLVVAIYSALATKKPHVHFMYKTIIPLMAAGLLLIPFLNTPYVAFANAAVIAGYILLDMFVWFALSNVAKESSTPIATVFGFGKVGMNFGLIGGTLLGTLLTSGSIVPAIGVSAFIVYLFIIVSTTMPEEKFFSLLKIYPKNYLSVDDQTDGKKTIQQIEPDTSESLTRILREKCSELTKQHELSSREEDVLELLARGRGAREIARTLGIAYSTAKTHVIHIYRKLEVHSKQELLDLIDSQ